MICRFKEPIPSESYIEHVLLCIRMRVEDRHGVILFDPGYHVSQPVTVMEDEAFPHSGFVEGSAAYDNVMKWFSYSFVPNNKAFIQWKVTETKDEVKRKEHVSLIYVTRPFLSGLDVAERRSLVFKFKSLICRDRNGRLTSGAYMYIRSITDTNVTLFYDSNGARKHYKKTLSYFLDEDANDLGTNRRDKDEEIEKALQVISKESGISLQEFKYCLKFVAELVDDSDFLREMNELNDYIEGTFD